MLLKNKLDRFCRNPSSFGAADVIRTPGYGTHEISHVVFYVHLQVQDSVPGNYLHITLESRPDKWFYVTKAV